MTRLARADLRIQRIHAARSDPDQNLIRPQLRTRQLSLQKLSPGCFHHPDFHPHPPAIRKFLVKPPPVSIGEELIDSKCLASAAKGQRITTFFAKIDIGSKNSPPPNTGLSQTTA